MTIAHLVPRGSVNTATALSNTDQASENRNQPLIDPWGRRLVDIPLPAGSLPTNVCIGGRRDDELLVTAAHAESLLRIRFDGEAPPL